MLQSLQGRLLMPFLCSCLSSSFLYQTGETRGDEELLSSHASSAVVVVPARRLVIKAVKGLAGAELGQEVFFACLLNKGSFDRAMEKRAQSCLSP